MRKVGNRKEVEKYQNPDAKLISVLETCPGNGSLKQWKKKFSPELVKKVEAHVTKSKKNTDDPYPDNTLALLRFIRNVLEHHAEEAANIDLLEMFPELFGCVYTFANSMRWNSETPLKEMFGTLSSRVVKPPSKEEHLKIPVQVSESSSTKPTA